MDTIRRRSFRHRLAMLGGYVVTAALLAAVLLQAPWAGVVAALEGGEPTYDEAARASAAPPEAMPTASPAAPAETRGARKVPPCSLRLRVPAWGQVFEVVDVEVEPDGSLVPPDDIGTLGRWADGACPGDAHGAVVLVVHRDSSTRGRGPFARLGDLPRGTRVTAGGVTYVLTDVATYPKDRLPARDLFGRDGDERLVILTCGGSYSPSRGWDSNVVATFAAVPRVAR